MAAAAGPEVVAPDGPVLLMLETELESKSYDEY